MARVDRLAELMTTDHVKVSRSSAMRAMIIEALPKFESVYARVGGKAQRKVSK